jgi:hypothetical protein
MTNNQTTRKKISTCSQAILINSSDRSSPLNVLQPSNFVAISPYTPSFLPTSPQILANNAIPMAAGTLAFAAILSISTLMQLKLFRISTGSPPPIPSMIGFGSVATAAAMSHIVSIKAFQIVKQDYPIFDAISKPFFDFKIQKDNVAHLLRVSAVGLLMYKGLGGRFWAVSPSSVTNLGSFARTVFSLPATEKYATRSQRKSIERLGRTFGCHTCGSRRIISRSKNGVKFIADHMPPQAVVKQMNGRWYRELFGMKTKQRFFPQCVRCSNMQGGILSDASRNLMKEKKSMIMRRKLPNLSDAGGGKNAFNHGMALRKEHFAGALVATCTTYNASDRDILGSNWKVKSGNRQRFLGWEQSAAAIVNNAKRTLQKYVSTN